jgi:succinoglycan biosynthesis protein ExoA
MAHTTPDRPGVSYVMPVFNEIRYIDAAVLSVLGQEYAGEQELVLALGPSTDGTSDRVEHIAEGDPRVRIVRNPETAIPIGLNRAIRAARHDVIVRVDAHSELSAGYTEDAVASLERTGAASLGGIMVAQGRTPFQQAVARAYNSRLGLGGGAYHGGAEEGPAESAYLGVMQRSALLDVGLYDEGLKRAEDWELNRRLRQAGYVVWLDPALRVAYWPRDTWQKLARQFVATGIWRGELVRRLGGRNPVRYFAPPALVLASAASVIVAALQVAGVLTGVASAVFGLVHFAPALYLVLLLGLLAAPSSGSRVSDRARFSLVIATMHFTWGAGFLRGLTVGARDAIDRSRLES